MALRTEASGQDQQDLDNILRIKDGDPQPLEDLYDRYGGQSLGYFILRTKNEQDARDLTQGLFEKILKKAHTFRKEKCDRPISWIGTIRNRELIDHFRGHPDTLSLEFAEARSMGVVSRQEEPMTNDPRKIALREAMGEITPSYRDALELRYFEGLEVALVAEKLGINLGTAKVHLHRARKALTKKMSEKGFE